MDLDKLKIIDDNNNFEIKLFILVIKKMNYDIINLRFLFCIFYFIEKLTIFILYFCF